MNAIREAVYEVSPALSLRLRKLAALAVGNLLGSVAVQPNHVIDLTLRSYSEVVAICETLLGSGLILLHGGNSRRPAPALEPRQANDAAKVSGNNEAVYATTEIDVALMYAIIDRRYLQTVCQEFAIGFATHSGRRVFTATTNVYKLLCNGDSSAYSDGYLYILDRSDFIRSPDAPTEFQTSRVQEPLCVLKLSATLSQVIVIAGISEERDTLFPHSRYDNSDLKLQSASPGDARTSKLDV